MRDSTSVCVGAVQANVTPNYLGFFVGDISKRQLEETVNISFRRACFLSLSLVNTRGLTPSLLCD